MGKAIRTIWPEAELHSISKQYGLPIAQLIIFQDPTAFRIQTTWPEGCHVATLCAEVVTKYYGQRTHCLLLTHRHFSPSRGEFSIVFHRSN